MDTLKQNQLGDNLDDILKKLWQNKRTIKSLDLESIMMAHSLAEARYLPIKDFLFEGMNDISFRRRIDCISILSNHFPNLESKYINKIREMVTLDPNRDVRSAAIGAFGIQDTPPDECLLMVMYTDPYKGNRKDAFWVLLGLCKVPRIKIPEALNRVEKKEVDLSIKGLEIILSENNIPIPNELLNFDPESIRRIRRKLIK